MSSRSYDLVCVVCGGPFTAAAANAKVCGQVCRRKRRAEQSRASYERSGRRRRRDRQASDPAAAETNRHAVRRWRQRHADRAREQTRQAVRKHRQPGPGGTAGPDEPSSSGSATAAGDAAGSRGDPTAAAGEGRSSL